MDLRGLRPVLLHRVLCLIRADAIIGRKAAAVAPAEAAAAAGLLGTRPLLLLLLLLALLLLLLPGMVLPAEPFNRHCLVRAQHAWHGSPSIQPAPPTDLFQKLHSPHDRLHNSELAHEGQETLQVSVLPACQHLHRAILCSAHAHVSSSSRLVPLLLLAAAGSPAAADQRSMQQTDPVAATEAVSGRLAACESPT